MNYTEHKIALDIHNTVSAVALRVKKGDTGRRLLIHLAEKGYPYHISEDCYAVFTAKKPDGKVVFNDCSIEDCVILYDFTAQTVAAAGLMDCEIILYGADGKQLTSASFNIIVEDTIYDTETEIESTDEYNALADLIGKTQKLLANGPVAQAIVRNADGTVISVTDASKQALQGLRIFGKSTQASNPTPDNPVEIVTVGAADGEVMLHIVGKNIFANSEMHAVDATGTEVNNGAARRTPYIPVLPGQKLSFSKSEVLPADSQPNGMLRMFDKNRKYVSSITALGYAELEKVVTIPDNIYFVRFVQYGFTYVDDLKVQIELAPAATEYDGTTGQSVVISTPNGLPGIPVSSGGNYTDTNGQQWICDEVDLARGVYVQRVRRALASAFVSAAYGEVGSHARIGFGIGNTKYNSIATPNGMCNVLPFLGNYSADQLHFYVQNQQLWVFVPIAELEQKTTEGVLNWLSSKGTEFQYILATPIETALTKDEIAAYAALHTYKPNTTIYNDAGAYMAAEYVADTKTYIDNNGGAAGSAATIGDVTLLASKWAGNASPYSQVVQINGVTENSQVDLTPSVEQLAVFHNKDLAFVTENEGGVVTVYALGDKPTNDYTIQVTITEVYV